MSKRPRLRPGERVCVEDGCDVVLPPPSGKGRPPVRCEEHRRKRRHRAASTPSSRRPRLRVVGAEPDPPADDDGELWDAPQPWQVARQEAAAAAVATDAPDEDDVDDRSVAAVVARDLDAVYSKHPAAHTLTALALRLARNLDTPGIGPRDAAALVKELRATVADLVREEAADDDDDLFGDGGAAPVVVPSTG